jgi:hypothetical protein
MGKHFIDPKSSEIVHFSSFSLYDANCLFLGQDCSLPFSLRSLDIPALLKSWKKHYSMTHIITDKIKICQISKSQINSRHHLKA